MGGETSGHIICLDKTTTGDGLISALQVLAIMKQTGAGLAELAAAMRKYPQVLLNVQVATRFDPLAEPLVLQVVADVERRFGGQGRIVLRASGTEPVIRVMVEGSDAALVKQGRPGDRRGRGSRIVERRLKRIPGVVMGRFPTGLAVTRLRG